MKIAFSVDDDDMMIEVCVFFRRAPFLMIYDREVMDCVYTRLPGREGR